MKPADCTPTHFAKTPRAPSAATLDVLVDTAPISSVPTNVDTIICPINIGHNKSYVNDSLSDNGSQPTTQRHATVAMVACACVDKPARDIGTNNLGAIIQRRIKPRRLSGHRHQPWAPNFQAINVDCGYFNALSYNNGGPHNDDSTTDRGQLCI